MDWRWVRSNARGAFLATLFVVESARLVANAWVDSWLGIDAHIYYRGSAAWLAGQSPWDAVSYLLDQPAHYSALPTTVVLLAPFTVVAESPFVVGFVLVSALAAVYIVRVLGLPWYYLAFPPLVHGVQSGNPNVILLALLITQRPVLEAVAPILKVYAAIPIVMRARWRSAAWAIAFGAFTVFAAPLWIEYAGSYADRTSRLMIEAGGGFSAWQIGPVAVAVTVATVALLWWRDREAGSWLSVPALWPASQFHYSMLALPVLRDRWWLAAILALPIAGLPALAPILVLVERVLRELVLSESPADTPATT
jgi:hypothetical protein